MNWLDAIHGILTKYYLVTAFAIVGFTVWISYFLSNRILRGRLHGSAIAILIGLVFAYLGGVTTGGKKGVADIEVLSGIGIMGGAMLRDLSIVATAFGVRLDEFRKTGLSGIVSLLIGVFLSFFVGASVAYAFGYRDAVSMTTIGGGTATYIVGPVTGSALGASSDVMALSVAAGLIKSILVMTATPLVAKSIGLDNPRSALIFGGLMGTTSGVAGGLAATDPELVPYGAMTATFYTGLGCLLGPSLVFIVIRTVVPLLVAS
ncbi:MAG: malonate transporter subunit MadM [Planctomycetaceae bacterium]|nr:malonate transporter subunit MadM [Planctomycetaceae bacterium]